MAKPGKEPRDFAVVLYELNKGRPHADITAGLTDVIRSVVDTGNPGKLTLTLTEIEDGVSGIAKVWAGRPAPSCSF